MQPKRNKWILIGLLIFAVFVGAAAIGTVYYYNSLEDVVPTDTDAADDTQFSCERVYIYDEELENIEQLDPTQSYTINADFIIETSEDTTEFISVINDKLDERDNDNEVISDEEDSIAIIGPPDTPLETYDYFVFTINGEHKYIVTNVRPIPTIDVLGNSVITYTPSFEFGPTQFADFQDDSTITITVRGHRVDDNNYLDEVDHTTCDDQDTTYPILWADTGDDSCGAAGELINTEAGESCCTGLTARDNSNLDENGVCQSDNALHTSICIAYDDGTCGTGENECNSPQDCAEVEDTCAEEGEAPGDNGCCTGLIEENGVCTTACIAQGQTVGAGESCCAGLIAEDNVCVPESASCIPEGGSLGTGDTCCTGLIVENGVCVVYEEPEADSSSFSVTKTGTSCVERVSPNNSAEFTITITNADDTYEDVLEVLDKLPLGFTYVAGSTTINGIQDATDQYLTIETVGSAQELTWAVTDGWSVAANGTMVITFSALAGDSALTGDVQNEVVVTPRNNPVSEDTLRTEFVFSVAQNCETPVTGIFDSTIGKILAGVTIIVLSTLFYWSKFGNNVSVKIVSSPASKGASDTYDGISIRLQKLVNPRESFERRFLKESEQKTKKK